MNILDEVSQYYRSRGISPRAFACKHLSDCKRNCSDFVEAREPSIGREYEKCEFSKVPRLLFLSLDAGKDENSSPEERTARDMQEREETIDHIDRKVLPHSQHWYLTHKLAWILLRQFIPSLSIYESCRYFAHTNSAKCCMNKPHNSQADPQLFKNCREYIPGEIEVLKPDILVTQGDWAMEAIRRNFSAKVTGNQKQCGYAVFRLKDKNVLWLHSYYPNPYAGFKYQKENCWSEWKKIVGQFWKDESRDRVAV